MMVRVTFGSCLMALLPKGCLNSWCSRLLFLQPGLFSNGSQFFFGEHRLTWELAYNKRPPIGAKMMPIMKKSGRTVFGVKIGLIQVNHLGLVGIGDSSNLLPCL